MTCDEVQQLGREVTELDKALVAAEEAAKIDDATMAAVERIQKQAGVAISDA